MSLQLGRQLGTEVTPVLSRKELAEPALRTEALVDQLVQDGQLSGFIRIPDTIGPLVVTADLRAKTVTCHVDIDASREGRPTTRVNWLIRQLKNAPEGVRVEATAAHSRGPGAAELLRVARENPAALIADPTKDLRSFRVADTHAMGSKRGRGRGAFIDSVLDSVDTFYADVIQNLKAWSAAPPRLRPAPPPMDPDIPAALNSTALSSQDDPVVGAEVVDSQEAEQESPSEPS